MKRTKRLNKGYIITNTINGKKYVGITSLSVSIRWKTHLNTASRPNFKSVLYKAINKYGVDSFTIKMAKKSYSWEEIQNWERDTIKRLNTRLPYGYNMTDGGEGTLGAIRTKAHRRSQSIRSRYYWSDPNHRKEQSIRQTKLRVTPKALEESSLRSSNLWQDPEYRKKTLLNGKKKWSNPVIKKRHDDAVRNSTTNNPEWRKKMTIKNKKMAEDPKWNKQLRKGVNLSWKNPERRINASKGLSEYWDNSPERKKRLSKEMSVMMTNRCQDPLFQKHRKEHPFGGKPVLYLFKYFRSLQEASDYFKISRATIDRNLLLKTKGCCRLDKTKQYNFIVQY